MKLKALLVASFLFSGLGYVAVAQQSAEATKTVVTVASFNSKIEKYQKEADANKSQTLLEDLKSDMKKVIANAKVQSGDNTKYTEVYNKIQMLINAGVIEKSDFVPLLKEFTKLM